MVLLSAHLRISFIFISTCYYRNLYSVSVYSYVVNIYYLISLPFNSIQFKASFAKRANSQSSSAVRSTSSESSESRLKGTGVSGYQKLENKVVAKKTIKPASSLLVKANENKIPSVGSKRLAPDSGHVAEVLELTEHNFYDHMKQYLLTVLIIDLN